MEIQAKTYRYNDSPVENKKTDAKVMLINLKEGLKMSKSISFKLVGVVRLLLVLIGLVRLSSDFDAMKEQNGCNTS
jgi:hypothetical protein